MPPRRISLSQVGRRNIVYSDAEQTDIKNALKTTEAGLLRLGTLRSNAPARRRQLKEQIRRCQAALAPFKKIPNEIWMYIFELYCQSVRLSTCVKRQPPVVITQVCSAWRQIALSMPKLWSDVHLGRNINLAKMWLRRGGNIPRALETTTPRSYCSSSIRPQTIQNLICLYPFRKLHITKCDVDRIDFTAIPVDSLLLLEDLALSNPAYNLPSLGVTSLFPHHFPNLASLHIDMNYMPLFHVSRPFATWKKLRVLRLNCVLDKVKCAEILRDSSFVEDCSLRLTETYSDQDLMIEKPVLANMKVLTISFSLVSALQWFMDRLTFPNLHTLVLIPQSSLHHQPHDTSSLLPIVSHTESLRSLNINQLYMSVDVGLMLECLPLLQVLELHGKEITPDIAEKIGRGELGGCLRELRDWNDCNLFELLRACELRRDVTQGQSQNNSGAIARLEKVSVMHSQSVADYRWRIRKLRKDGVRFEAFRVTSRVRST